MTLTDDIEQFQTHTAKSSETLEEVNQLANKLFECSTDELASLLAKIESLCEQAQTQIKYTANCLIEINKSWGSEPLQHYSEKQLNTNKPTGSTSQGGNSSTQSATVSENGSKQVEADDLAPRIEQAKELLDNAVGISGNFLSQAYKTGKNLQVSLIMASTLTDVALRKTVDAVDLTPWMEQATKLLNKGVDVCGKLLNEAVKTGKSLSTYLMLVTSFTGTFFTRTSLTKQADFFYEVIYPSISILTDKIMPVSGIYKSLKIDEKIDETKKALGINDEILDGLDTWNDLQEEEKKRKSAAQSTDESRGASSK